MKVADLNAQKFCRVQTRILPREQLIISHSHDSKHKGVQGIISAHHHGMIVCDDAGYKRVASRCRPADHTLELSAYISGSGMSPFGKGAGAPLCSREGPNDQRRAITMQVTTATWRAGGMGRSPSLKSLAKAWLAASIFALFAILHSREKHGAYCELGLFDMVPP